MAPRNDLSGITALITGAAKRLGRAMASALAAEGVNIVAHYNTSASEAEDLCAQVEGMGGKAWAVQANLADPAEAAQLCRKAVGSAGEIGILINNASIFPQGSLADLTPETLGDNIQINAMSPFVIGRDFAAQGRTGHIINLLDCRIAEYDEAHVPYHLSKRMLYALTRMMAVEFAPAVQVNAVAPGLILPPEGKDVSYLEELAHTNPLNRHGDEDDIVQAVLYLLRSTFVTGQVLYVDGGRNVKGNMYG